MKREAVKGHDHEYTPRWYSIRSKCFNINERDYNDIGGKGIRIASVWASTNPNGLFNFVTWVEKKLKERPDLEGKMFYVTRKNITKNYSPANCHVLSISEIIRSRKGTMLPEKTVIKMRAYKKEFPSTTMEKLKELFVSDICKVSISSINKAVNGISFEYLDEREAPWEGREPVIKPVVKPKAKKTTAFSLWHQH
jgi:hypothetical protein